jgi:pyruvate formate lyase activating enzyme
MIEDGPGIRTTVFFKGCPLRCVWCSNAFGLSREPEIVYNRRKCVLCGACVAACPQNALRMESQGVALDRDKCTTCGSCVSACLSAARAIAGRTYSPREIVSKVLDDSKFYRRCGGGVTLSGGEVLLQASAAAEILDLCRCELIHSAVETSGYGPWPALRSLVERCELIFMDIKHSSDEAHRRLTGVSNRTILENIRLTAQHVAISGSPRLVLRVPVIPGINSDYDNMVGTARFIAGLPIAAEINLLPYHQLGAGKYEMAGLQYGLDWVQAASAALLDESREILRDLAPEWSCTIGGGEIGHADGDEGRSLPGCSAC